MMDVWPVLDTPRLRLRRWMERDLVPFTEMSQDPEVMRFYSRRLHPLEAIMAIELFEQNFDRHGYGFWAVELRDTLEFVGSVGFEPCSLPGLTMPSVMIGWQLMRKFWGKGYAEEAACAVIRYAFEQLNIRQVLALSAPDNTHSARLLSRLGMELAADLSGGSYLQGLTTHPQKIYRLRAPEEG